MENKTNKKNELKKLYIAGTITKEQLGKDLVDLELKEKPPRDNLKYHKAWVYQTALINSFEKEGRPSINDVIDKIKLLKPQRYKALFVLLYLTAARISEVVKITTPRHIEQTIKLNRPFLVIRLENRKNRQRHYKEILVPLDYPPQEKLLADILINYITGKDRDKVLFPMTKTAVHIYFKKYIGWNCHIIRHLRCTHLMVMYGINPEMLKKIAGWTDLRPTKAYINLVTDDLAAVFPKEDKENKPKPSSDEY